MYRAFNSSPRLRRVRTASTSDLLSIGKFSKSTSGPLGEDLLRMHPTSYRSVSLLRVEYTCSFGRIRIEYEYTSYSGRNHAASFFNLLSMVEFNARTPAPSGYLYCE